MYKRRGFPLSLTKRFNTQILFHIYYIRTFFYNSTRIDGDGGKNLKSIITRREGDWILKLIRENF